MSVKLELEILLSSKADYDRLITGLLDSLEKAKEKSQIIKNIILYCKNCLSVASKAITKYLAVRVGHS